MYVGPAYKRGIVLGGTTYDPKNMSEEEITSFLEKYPERSGWWNTEIENESLVDLNDGSSDDDKEEE